MNIPADKIKKILCIKPRGIGDIILSTIVLENIKAALPHSKIHFLTENFAKRAVENNPFISKVLTFKKSDFILKVILKIRKEKYDLVFDFWSNPKTAQITFLSGVKYKVGFGFRGRKYAYNIIAQSGEKNLHAAEANLQLLKAVDIPVISKNILYYLEEKEKQFAQKYFSDNFQGDEVIIGIIPSGGWSSKRCEPAKWIEICQLLVKEIDCRFLILWGPDDKNDAELIGEALKSKAIISPSTSIGEMSALISECSLVIANDSGPMHIAAALKVPTIGIFGPTNPENHKPYSVNSDYVIKKDLHCIICNKIGCPYNHECMKELDPKELITKVRILINRSQN